MLMKYLNHQYFIRSIQHPLLINLLNFNEEIARGVKQRKIFTEKDTFIAIFTLERLDLLCCLRVTGLCCTSSRIDKIKCFHAKDLKVYDRDL